MTPGPSSPTGYRTNFMVEGTSERAYLNLVVNNLHVIRAHLRLMKWLLLGILVAQVLTWWFLF